MVSQQNSRKHSRAAIYTKVTFRGERCWIYSDSANLSEGGMYIHAIGQEPVGSPAEIEFELPQKDLPVMVEGIVVWLEGNSPRAGGGIKFTKLKSQDKQSISKYVKQNAKGLKRR